MDAGIRTGRNCEFYPPAAIVSRIDTSAAMLARAHDRCPTLAAGGRLYKMDVTALPFPTGSFDAAVSSFLAQPQSRGRIPHLESARKKRCLFSPVCFVRFHGYR